MTTRLRSAAAFTAGWAAYFAGVSAPVVAVAVVLDWPLWLTALVAVAWAVGVALLALALGKVAELREERRAEGGER